MYDNENQITKHIIAHTTCDIMWYEYIAVIIKYIISFY